MSPDNAIGQNELQEQATALRKKHEEQGKSGTVRLPEDKTLPPGVRIVDGQIVSMPVAKQ